jgi:hypothetical protein
VAGRGGQARAGARIESRAGKQADRQARAGRQREADRLRQ